MVNAPKIAAIVPAYNEARHIEAVLRVLQEVDLLDEIIVVDDGSSDDTSNKTLEIAASDRRFHLIRHERNLGKGQSILTGRKATNAPVLLLLDADLIGLSSANVISLIEPILNHGKDMVLGLFKGGKFLTDLSHSATPWLTGQRCLRSATLDELDSTAASGYGFETALSLTAYQNGWSTEIVWLHGVWHPHGEIHRGLIRGLLRRAGMYFQIFRAWYRAGGIPVLKSQIKKWWVLFLILGIVVISCMVISGHYAAGSSGEIGYLVPLEITSFDKILVVAPHPDDETLAAGGVIQQALAQNAHVKVVVVTNGDGQKFAPMLLNDKIKPKPPDYILVGERRQAESMAALKSLGLQPEDVFFLGYPDRGIGPMWLADWRSQCPYHSVYTKVDFDPYPNTFDKRSSYCGENLLLDMQNILDDYRPDLIILPHPSDQHPDHGAVSNFSRMAVASISVKDGNYQPQIWGYIVHYGMFPEPRGKYFEMVLAPPKKLLGKESNWGQVILTPMNVSAKYSAINDYSSQIKLLGKFLPSFARSNELYESLSLGYLPPVSFTALPVLARNEIENIDTGVPYTTNEEYPIKGNMFLGWQVIRLANVLRINLDVRRDVLPDLKCTLYLKLQSGETYNWETEVDGPWFRSKVFWKQIDLSTLENPPVVAFAAEIRQGGYLLSKTGWHILILE